MTSKKNRFFFLLGGLLVAVLVSALVGSYGSKRVAQA